MKIGFLFISAAVGALAAMPAQAQTSEATLPFIPKLLAVFAVLVIAGPWMLGQIVDYMRTLFSSIPQLVA